MFVVGGLVGDPEGKKERKRVGAPGCAGVPSFICKRAAVASTLR